jgi:hypothetical protein
MQLPRRLVLAGLAAALTGCALLGFGPPTGVVEGTVFSAEAGAPIPHAEVCAFGTDTVCVRADARGVYRVRLRPQTVLLRFRSGELPPAAADSVTITESSRFRVDCSIAGRLVISDRPVPCLPAPGR